MAKTSLYLNEQIKAKLRVSESVGLAGAVSRAVDRLDLIIQAEEKRLAGMFTDGEWSAMRAAANGTIWEPAGVIRGGMLAEIQDSLDGELQAHGVDRAGIQAKLAALTVAQQVVLVDMVERWWAAK